MLVWNLEKHQWRYLSWIHSTFWCCILYCFLDSSPSLNQAGCLLIEAISRWKHAHIASEAVRPPRSEAAMPCWAAEYIGFVRQTSLWGWEQGRRNRGCREGQRNAYHKTSTYILFLWKWWRYWQFNNLPEYMFPVSRIIVLDNLAVTREFSFDCFIQLKPN